MNTPLSPEARTIVFCPTTNSFKNPVVLSTVKRTEPLSTAISSGRSSTFTVVSPPKAGPHAATRIPTDNASSPDAGRAGKERVFMVFLIKWNDFRRIGRRAATRP